MAKEHPNEQSPEQPSDNWGAFKLIEWRIQQLEQQAAQREQDHKIDKAKEQAEVERRRKSVDEDIERIKGNLSSTLRRIDWSLAKIVFWVVTAVGVTAWLVERYFESQRK